MRSTAARVMLTAPASPPIEPMVFTLESEKHPKWPSAPASAVASETSRPPRSSEIARSLARVVTRAGRGLEALRVLHDALEGARHTDSDMALRLEAETFAAARSQPGATVPVPQAPRDDRPDLTGNTSAERLLLACL